MKNRPTRRQADVRAQQRDAAAQRRSDRESTALSQAPRTFKMPRLFRRAAAAGRAAGDEPTRTYRWLVEHPDRGRHTRPPGRRGHRSRNVPYVNPLRDVKSLRSGRLRAELQP